MPSHPSAFAYFALLLSSTTDPAQRDKILDAWIDARTLATEADARPWGFKPRWCARERQELMRRARFSLGVVQLDDAL